MVVPFDVWLNQAPCSAEVWIQYEPGPPPGQRRQGPGPRTISMGTHLDSVAPGRCSGHGSRASGPTLLVDATAHGPHRSPLGVAVHAIAPGDPSGRQTEHPRDRGCRSSSSQGGVQPSGKL